MPKNLLSYTKYALPVVAACLLALPVQAQTPERLSGKRGMLQSLDTNGDGAISREEFRAKRMEAFKKLDRNNDGQISLDEFMGQDEGRLFERLDKNSDGLITRDELQGLRKQRFGAEPK
jgi:Ca2+-binding EF-hand superfamily protein